MVFTLCFFFGIIKNVLDITLLGCYEFSQLDLGKSNKPQTWKRWLNLARSPDRLNETNTSLLSEETKADSGYCAVLLVCGMASRLIMSGAVLYSSPINL